MNFKELTALATRMVTEQTLGHLASLADYTVNQIRDFARSTMIAHLLVQVTAGVLAVSGVLALSLGWSIYASGTLVGWETVFYINCGLFTASIFLILFTLYRYTRKRHDFARQTDRLTRNLTESILHSFSIVQSERNASQQEERLEKLEKSIELLAQAIAEEQNNYNVVSMKDESSKERSQSNA